MNEQDTIGVIEIDEVVLEQDDFPPMLVHLYPKRRGMASRITYCGLTSGQNPHQHYHRSHGLSSTTYLASVSLPDSCPKCGAPFCPECVAVRNWRIREEN